MGRITGEAIHTQTFLGHPVGCAAALAVLDLLEGGLLEQIRERSQALKARFPNANGRGLMLSIDVDQDALAASRALLQRGFLILPNGPRSLQLVPPVSLTDAQLDAFCDALEALP